MRRWLQTTAELVAAALLHLAVLTAVGFGGGADRAGVAANAEKEADRDDPPKRVVRIAGPGRSTDSGRRSEELPGFPVPVAAQEAPEGRAVMLPAVSREQAHNGPDGELSARRNNPASVPRPELSRAEPQLARGARGDPAWELPGQRARPLQIFPSPMPGPTPGRPALQRLPPSGGSQRHAKLAVRGFEAAPAQTSRAPADASPSASSRSDRDPATHAEAAPGPLEPTALKLAGQEAAPSRTSGGGGGIQGPAPTTVDAPQAGAADHGSGDGTPTGAAPRGEDQAQDEQRPAQLAREQPEALPEQAKPKLATSAVPEERSPDDRTPPSSSAVAEHRRSSTAVPAADPVRGPLATADSSQEGRSVPPEGDVEHLASPSTRAPAPAGPEDVLSQRRMDQSRPGEPSERYRERAERALDTPTTGPTEGARVTGPPGLHEAPGADPLARQGTTGPIAERAPRHPSAHASGESAPQPDAPRADDSVQAPTAAARPSTHPDVLSADDPAQAPTETDAVARLTTPAAHAALRPEAPRAEDSAQLPSAEPMTPAKEAPSPRPTPRVAEEPSPPDPEKLPEVAEAPSSDQRGPHVPRPQRNPEDRPTEEGVPGGVESQQPVLLAMAPPSVQSALEGAGARLDLPGDDRLDSAQRSLASATEMLDLAALEGGEVGARRADEAAAALAAAEEALRGLEAPDPSQTTAPAQAGVVTDLPQGGGQGDEPGSPRLGGNGRLNALAQDRVSYVASLVGPSIARRAGRSGTGKVDFRVDERGYVREVAIRRSTGDGQMDQEIEPTLHLAEPFAVTPGWISVVVRFEPAR